MKQWKNSGLIHGILLFLLAGSVLTSVVSGMLMHTGKEYSKEEYEAEQSTFYVAQEQFEHLLDGYLRLYEEYMQIGSIIARDGVIDYDTVLMESLTESGKKVTLKELLRDASNNGVYSSQFRGFMEDFPEQSSQGISYPWKTQFHLEAKNRLIVEKGQIYQFTNFDRNAFRESQINNARKYMDNMVLIDSVDRKYSDQFQEELSVEVESLNGTEITFAANSSYEKYIITYYPDYAKWYFLNDLWKHAQNENGEWNRAFEEAYDKYYEETENTQSMEQVYRSIEEEVDIWYRQIPEDKFPWMIHQVPRTWQTATDYAVFLVETYQELKYLFAESNFIYAYQASDGMLLTNGENWWTQVRQNIQSDVIEKASDQDDIIFVYYDSMNYEGVSNLQKDTLEMSGEVQEKLKKIGEEYQNRSFQIAVGVNLDQIRRGMPKDYFSIQYQESQKKANLYRQGRKVFVPAVLIVMILTAVLLIRCGHQDGTEEIILNGFDRIWLEIICALVLFLGQIGEWIFYMWDASTIRFIFLVAAVLLAGLTEFGIFVLISIVKRFKAGCFWSQSLILRFIRDIVFRRMKLRDCLQSLRQMYWDLSLFQRYMTLFLAELLVQGYLTGFLIWVNIQSHNKLQKFLFTRNGIIALVLWAGGMCFLVLWQLRAYYNAKVDQMIIRESEKISRGEFSHQLRKPVSVNHEKEQLIENLNHIGESFEEAVENSVRSERMKTELIANVSHDIKTPLTSVINYVDLLKREPTDNEKIRSYVEVLERKSLRLKTLIEDLIEASKASSGAMELNMGVLDFSELVLQTNGEFEEYFHDCELELIVDIPDQPLLFEGDGRRVFRILENLYTNTAKYAMRGTRVYVAVQCWEQNVIFSIKNISAAKLNITPEELTERFVRGDSSRTTEGSGLGLSIAKSLTELMQGEFRIFMDGDLFQAEVSFPEFNSVHKEDVSE